MRLIVLAVVVALSGCGSTGPVGPSGPTSTVWSCNYATSCPSGGIRNFKASFCDTTQSVAQSRTIAQCRQEQVDPKCTCSSEYCYDTGQGC